MKTIHHTFMVAGALALTSAGATAQVGASFQVNSFSYSVSAGSLLWQTGGAYQTLAVESAEAGGLLGNDTDAANAAVLSNVSLSTAVPHASASAGAGSNGLVNGAVTAFPAFVSSLSVPHFGTAMAQQSQTFSLSQAGTVTFTVGYTLAASALAGDNFYTYGQTSLEFAAGNYENASGGTSFVELFSFDQANGANTQTGTFSWTVTMAGPAELGYYNLRGNAYASATAAVPEPGQWAMLAAGLALMAGLTRRRASR